MKVNTQSLKLAVAQARTEWLQVYLIKTLDSLLQPESDYQAWFDSFLEVLKSRGLKEPAQQKNRITDVRNAIKTIDPQHSALDVVKIDTETWTEINNSDSDRIAQRTTKFIDDPDAIASLATTLLGSYRWSEVAAGLAVVTGRRCTEVIKTAEFEPKSKYSVVFSGSLKRRSETVECIFEIPTLCKAGLVINAISSLRDKLGGEIETLSKRQINSRFSKAVASQCDRYFSHLVPSREGEDNLYTHLFRAVYATIAAHWYCPPTVPEMEFRAAVQGHYQILDEKNPELRRSLAASRHYFDYKIGDGSGNVDGRLGIKLNLPSVKVIEQFKSYIPTHTQTVETKSSDRQSDSDVKPTPKLSFSNETKTTRRQRQSNMSQTPARKDLAIPAFLRSRLETIANQLGLSPTQTIEELFKWAEVGISLANELELDELDPNAVFDLVRSLRQVSGSTFNEPSAVDRDSSEELAAAKQQIASLIDSQLSMSKAMEQAMKHLASSNPEMRLDDNLTHDHVQAPHPSADERRVASIEEEATQPDLTSKAVSPVTSRQTGTEKPSDSSSSSREKRKRDRPDVVKKDINNAIDAIIGFNDSPGRKHNHKFYIGIGSVRELCNRGGKSINQILDQRKEEIEQHLEKHELDINHNLSRRDDQGNEYPKIDQEQGVGYHKITEVSY